MDAYIKPPVRIPALLRFAAWIAKRKTGKDLLVARLLAWYPKAAIGAGVMESLVANKEGRLDGRLLKLVRMQVSFNVSCPFCIDMNSTEYASLGITEQEIGALQGAEGIEGVASFSEIEKAALRYAVALTRSPISVSRELLENMTSVFTEREMVIIVSTIAQVNFWTRLVQGLGVPPAGFTPECAVLNIGEYNTLEKQADG